MQRKITIIKTEYPVQPSINDQLQWLGGSLGLFNLRDKDKSCFRLFITLIKANRAHMPLSTDQLAHELHLTRATVIHHLKKLEQAGMVYSTDNKYAISEPTLQESIEKMEQDITTSLQEMKRIAKDIDEQLGL